MGNQPFLQETHQKAIQYFQQGCLDEAYQLVQQAAAIDPQASSLASGLCLQRLAFDETLEWSRKGAAQDTVAWCAQAAGIPNMTEVAAFIFGTIRSKGLHVLDCYVRGRGMHAPDPRQGGIAWALKDFYILYEVHMADSQSVVWMTREYEANKRRLGVHPRLLVDFTSPELHGFMSEAPLPGMMH